MEEKQYSTFTTSASKEQLAGKSNMASSHKPCFVVLLFINVFLLLLVFVFNGLSNAGGIFTSSPGEQADKYYLDITPAGWTFSIWGFIYTFQALWVAYSVINVFRKTAEGSPVYISPVLIPPVTIAFYMGASCGNIAWLFLFDRDHIQVSFAALFLLAACLIVALIFSYRILDQASSSLAAQGRFYDIWLVRSLVHNGLGIYATWTCIASLLNMAMVITYSKGSDVSISTASTIALVVLSIEIVAFVSTDLLLLDRYSRYTFTPYIVVVVALGGSISKNWESGATNSIFSAVLLAFGAVFLVIKFILSFYRHKTRPSYSKGQISSTLEA